MIKKKRHHHVLLNTQEQDFQVLFLADDFIDHRNFVNFKQESRTYTQNSDKVILDLTGVNFVDSAGLGAILSLMRGLTERKGVFRICSVSKSVAVLFDLVKIHQIIEIYDTRDMALKGDSK